ncbi:MAG: alpha/beta hydrolase [Candidatus Abyssobacteria bacterium SURF_5]|uniref:Alpha/beta hydrolase n=1 Tax=Abyssobacteria bacterium (strain SURF_5) TaxID=2093360 RepID=A0A3A4MVR2_ABYX5|nr:MAG: alpha/beta hydrolase [Candidatus Abyssubacteria bacterium SURF_5]
MVKEKIKQTVDVKISPKITLPGILDLPKETESLVIFAHGSGSSRFSPRNSFVAHELQESGIGTLLFDLLTEEEDLVYENRFNIDLIADRLIKTTQWLNEQGELRDLVKGYFGASTGAAAALQAAAALRSEIMAVVSRGGRPDLAMEYLPRVEAPTLLIVGERDRTVIELNMQALARLKCTKELAVITGASHLFEEAGTLEEVSRAAAGWFKRYLAGKIAAA